MAEKLAHDIEYSQVQLQVADGLKLGNAALEKANTLFRYLLSNHLGTYLAGLRIRSIFIRIRILQIRILKPDPDPGSYWHLKNQFKHENFFHIKHISSDI